MKAVLTWINGQPGHLVDVSERALQYGDGLFETIRVHASQPQCLNRHLQRLAAGCRRLNFPALTWELIGSELRALASERDDAVVKLILSRRSAGRGYRPGADQAVTRIASLYSLPQWPSNPSDNGIRVRICDTRLCAQPLLAGIKHLNRLEQVLARAEWEDAGIAEGLMLTDSDRIIEGTMTNVFMVSDQVLVTPDLSSCGVAGVMRSVILDLAKSLGIATQIRAVSLADVQAAEEIFVCNSLIGIWPVIAVGDAALFECGPMTRQLQAALTACEETDDGDWYP